MIDDYIAPKEYCAVHIKGSGFLILLYIICWKELSRHIVHKPLDWIPKPHFFCFFHPFSWNMELTFPFFHNHFSTTQVYLSLNTQYYTHGVSSVHFWQDLPLWFTVMLDFWALLNHWWEGLSPQYLLSVIFFFTSPEFAAAGRLFLVTGQWDHPIRWFLASVSYCDWLCQSACYTAHEITGHWCTMQEWWRNTWRCSLRGGVLL